MIFSVRGPVSRLTAMAGGTIHRSGRDRAVGTMARGAGVMLLVIRRVDEVLTRGQRCRMTARTLAVQGHIAGRRMINVMIGPVATRMTTGTGVRTAFVAHCRADQGVGARIVTGGAVIMDLGICRIGEGGCRIDVTDQTGRLAGYVSGRNVIHAVIDIRNLRRVTGGAGHSRAARNGRLDGRLQRSTEAIVRVAVTGRTVA